jgi:iron complex outermembrane receptor protein
MIKIFAAIVFLAGISFAQTYSIKGIVTDTSGIPLTGVNVLLVGTRFGTATNSNGFFELKNLTPGKYSLRFSMIGYERHVLRNVTLENQSLNLTIILKEKILQSEQVVVTAGKHEQKIGDLPVSASIIEPDFIEKKAFTNLENVLRYAPGINMTEGQISIRGSSGYSRGAGTRALVAIDGIPYYTGDTGETIWEVIPLHTLERIEIIKGASSSLYGSSAIGGVINVITKPIQKSPVTFIKSHFGFYDKPSHEEWDWSDNLRTLNGLTVAHSNRIGNFGFGASFTRYEDLSYKQNNYSKKYIGFLKGTIDFENASSITLLANSFNKRGGSFLYWKNSRNALVPPDNDQGETISTNRYMAGLLYQRFIFNGTLLNVKASYYRNNWSDRSEVQNNSTSNLYRGEIQTTSEIFTNAILVSGIEASTANVKSSIFGNPGYSGFGVYSQMDYSYNLPVTLTFGLRYDMIKLDTLESSNAFSPKLGLNIRITDDLRFRSSIGTGFRAPSLAEAFTSTSTSGITVKPNPNLKPEKNFSLEAGLFFTPGDAVSFDIAFFRNEYFDFIEPGIDLTDGLVIFDNVTRARILGLEFNSKFFLLDDALTLSANYTYLWARDINERKFLKYRPRHIAVTGIDYKINSFEIGADFRYWSRIEEIDIELIELGLVPEGDKRVAVYVLDLRCGLGFSLAGLAFKTYLNVNNALNYNYVELIGNIAPIRHFNLSLEISI